MSSVRYLWDLHSRK